MRARSVRARALAKLRPEIDMTAMSRFFVRHAIA
jgi:hypothetical protein